MHALWCKRFNNKLIILLLIDGLLVLVPASSRPLQMNGAGIGLLAVGLAVLAGLSLMIRRFGTQAKDAERWHCEHPDEPLPWGSSGLGV